MKKSKILLLAAAIVIEIAAIFLITKSISSDSSPVIGIVFLAIGLMFLIIGITSKENGDEKNSK
jgi:hypothetical protein